MSKPKLEENIVPFESVEGFKEFVSEPNPGIEGNPTMTVAQLVENKRILDKVKKETEERLSWVGGQLLLAMATSGVEKAKLEDGAILKVGYGRSASKIEPTLLLAQGVTVDQIQAATIEGTPYSYAQILKPKSGG